MRLSEEILATKKAIDDHKKELKSLSVNIDKAQKNI
jgi:hypothetical protein